MNKPYVIVPTPSLISKDLLAHALNALQESWVTYYNFSALPAPHEILITDPFLLKLAGKRKLRGGILRLEPDTCYDWHVDTDRKVGLNMLLSDDGGSRCLFLDGEPGLVFKVQELKYRPAAYYVFNTQVPHAVLNTTKPRYLFSLEFLEEDRGLTFDELCEDLKGMTHGY